MAEARIARMDALYGPSALPETPDLEAINQTLIEVREEFYGRPKQQGLPHPSSRKAGE